MKNKTYLAVSGLDGRDELYSLNKTTVKKFEKLFGEFDKGWADHNGAIEWVIENAVFVGFCTCVSLNY